MLELVQRAYAHPEFWKYASIPFVAGIVGWVTNWVAVKLTFYPLQFRGWKPWLGWQGIIPSKAGRMAEIFVDSTMSRLGTLAEYFREMQPQRIGDHIVQVMAPRMREFTDDVMAAHHPRLWERLPPMLREQIYQRIDNELPVLVEAMMDDIADRVDGLVDLKQMIKDRLVGEPRVLNRLFLESGAKEFRFIVRSGFTFGFLFGLIQLAVWILLPAWWVLPLFGLLVGYATNWIAINIIFRPLRPKKIGPFTLQGLFLKRQHEVSAVWCGLVVREIMTISAIVDNMLHGNKHAATRSLIQHHMRPIVDEAVAGIRPMAQMAVGVDSFIAIKETVGKKALSVSAAPFNDPSFIEERAEVVGEMLTARMKQMPSEDFQNLLRPCFQEDEWKLILTGAVLGGIAGAAQLLLVFGL